MYFLLEFSVVFFITSVSTLSAINLGVIFPFVFVFRSSNLPCEIIYLVLFLFGLLCWIYFCCLRLWNVPCEILGLVLFVFASSLCRNLFLVFSCGTLPVRYSSLCLFLFDLLYWITYFLLSAAVERSL